MKAVSKASLVFWCTRSLLTKATESEMLNVLKFEKFVLLSWLVMYKRFSSADRFLMGSFVQLASTNNAAANGTIAYCFISNKILLFQIITADQQRSYRFNDRKNNLTML